MTFETPQEPQSNFEDINSDMPDHRALTVIKTEIQFALMKDFGINEEDHEKGLEWVEKYAKDFSEYLHEHPDCVSEWIAGDKESVLETLIQAEKEGFPHRETH